MPYGGSPIMNYGGEDDDIMGGFCPSGTELNIIAVVIVGLILLYYLGVFSGLTEGFVMGKSYPIKGQGKSYYTDFIR
jgi:hypothetical protein